MHYSRWRIVSAHIATLYVAGEFGKLTILCKGVQNFLGTWGKER